MNDEQQATQRDLDNLHRRFDEHYAERMERIERKLSELTEAVVSIARAEEKIAALIDDTREMKYALNGQINRIHQLELDTEQNKRGLQTLSKVFWVAVGAASVAFATMFANSLGL